MENVNKMQVLVTGASGFIGKALTEALLSEGYSVKALTRSFSKSFPKAVTVVRGDLCADELSLGGIIDDCNVVIHCAGEPVITEKMHAIHIEGTRKLLSELHASVQRKQRDVQWVNLSSCGAYGQTVSDLQKQRHIDESAPDNPKGEYECTKVEADNMVLKYAETYDWFRYTIIRPTIVFGVGMRSKAIIRLCKLIKKKLFFYVGNKNAIANYVGVADVVNAILHTLSNTKAYNETFIVSNDCKFNDAIDVMADTLKTSRPNAVLSELFVRIMIKLLGKLVKLPISNNQIDVMMRQTNYSNEKLKTQLKWSPLGSVLDQLASYVEIEVLSENG